jgi:hypothetical protein
MKWCWRASPLVLSVALLAGCGGSTHRAVPPKAAPTGSLAPTTTVAPTTKPSERHPSKELRTSVQTDAQMKAAGNEGPSSSILRPAKCELEGTTATAEGTYQGGFAPNAYSRYGDIVDLYVFTGPSPGYPEGVQVAGLSPERSPAIGGRGTWQVTEPVDLSFGQPERCVVAAQPTHDFQGAP